MLRTLLWGGWNWGVKLSHGWGNFPSCSARSAIGWGAAQVLARRQAARQQWAFAAPACRLVCTAMSLACTARHVAAVPRSAAAAGHRPFPRFWSSRVSATATSSGLATGNAAPVISKRLEDPSVPTDVMSPLYPWKFNTKQGCPSTYSVTLQGAKGDGSTNDAPALAKAAAAYAALYFPLLHGTSSTVYRIGSSLTLNSPLVVPCGVRLYLNTGVTLLLTAQPKVACMQQPIFAGPGTVRVRGTAREVYPSWWGAPGTANTAGFQAGADACVTGTCAVVLARATGLTAPVVLRGNSGVFATSGATIYPVGGSPSNIQPWGALTLAAGTYSRPISLSSILAFATGIKVMGGVSGATVFAGTLTYGAHLVQLAPAPGTVIKGLNMQVVACASGTNCVELVGAAGALATVSSSVVRVNFATTLSGAGVLAYGTRPPVFSRAGVVFQAVDPTAANNKFVVLRNSGATTTKGLTVGVETWCGGFATSGTLPGGQLVLGAFTSLLSSFYLATLEQPVYTNIWSASRPCISRAPLWFGFCWSGGTEQYGESFAGSVLLPQSGDAQAQASRLASPRLHTHAPPPHHRQTWPGRGTWSASPSWDPRASFMP